ncbi:MAG TPA: hypothetical protein VEB60_02340, partial [Candidatus Paceibacterota bacterium]|nr:hypothetical protein [Candidatus Paceibacterota bacterium]
MEKPNLEISAERDIARERQETRREMLEAFKNAGYPLDWTLEAMLSESRPEDQGNRKGSGFTQASRRVAEFVRRSRSDRDLQILGDEVRWRLEEKAYEASKDGDELVPVDLRKYLDVEALRSAEGLIRAEECRLLAQMIIDVLNPGESRLTDLRAAEAKLPIGTCTTAERYFLDHFSGANSYDSTMNLIVDEKDRPLMVEKLGAGENHSAITLQEVVING